MALKTVFEYCFNAIEFYPKSNRFVLASRRKSNHFVLKIRLGGFADYTRIRRSSRKIKILLHDS
nr:MAG TPA: hypothetical protein [Bacteriophage sp.]